ncbi:refilin B [Clarias gariepinus]|uniref:refilin B n=1 Tax=Clarias gariepinus TaxID=13013 RepID=UPI00234CD7AD|nr:refilin B [Clarias gariepinus]XP_053362730.1 refilin B [Clarias gariepinus]
MVGRLNLRNVCDEDLLEMNLKAERLLDSPDSGLPPSPSVSPSPWLSGDRSTASSVCEDESRAATLAAGPPKLVRGVFQLHPFSYGEGIELDPLPPKELRYTSSVRYGSDRHYIQDVCLQPTGLGLELCSQTIIASAKSTWRRYKTQLELVPRQRVHHYQSTTIVYPKHARTLYTTQLNYDGRKLAKRFLSSVELKVSNCKANQY